MLTYDYEVFPVDLANQLIVEFCGRSSVPVRPGEMVWALALEAEERLGRRVPPAEAFFYVLMQYMEQARQTHEKDIIARRREWFPGRKL